MSGQPNYYEILGVSYEASAEQIRAAFRKLAMERHPDRFSGEARTVAEQEFQTLTEAYNVLFDAEQRARYDKSLGSRMQDVASNPKELARALLARAVTVMKSGDAEKAELFFSQAVAHDPQNAKAQHLFGLFLARQPGRLEEALRNLDQAVRLDPLNVRALLDASRLFARAGMFARATRFASSAAELSPGDTAVEAWLQQLQAERTRSERGRDRSGRGSA